MSAEPEAAQLTCAGSPSRGNGRAALLSLPKEILDAIASDLPTTAAVHAAQSCRALSAVLEPHIYARLDYTVPFEENDRKARGARERREQRRLAALARELRVPARVGYVVEAAFTLLPYTVHDIAEILKRLTGSTSSTSSSAAASTSCTPPPSAPSTRPAAAPSTSTLQSLTIAFHPDIISNPHVAPASFFETIHELDISFPSLRRLRIQDLPLGLSAYLPVLLARTPRLEALTIASEHARTRRLRPFSLLCPLPTELHLDRLSYLELNCAERGTPDAVRKMVKSAKRLETLVLRHGMAGTGRPSVIVDHPSLRRLDWRRWCTESFERMEYQGGFQSLTELAIGCTGSPLDKDIVMNYQIPSIPSLETVFLFPLGASSPSFVSVFLPSTAVSLPSTSVSLPSASPDADADANVDAVRHAANFDAVWHTAVPRLVASLSLSPALTSLQILDQTNPNSAHRVPIRLWETRDIRGAAFRTYTNGLHEVVSCRSRFRCGFGGAAAAEWDEVMLYDRRPVPMQLVDDVFQMMTQDKHWTEPGRELALPNTAWERLRLWARCG